MSQPVSNSSKSLNELKSEFDGWLLMLRDAKVAENKAQGNRYSPPDSETLHWSNKREGRTKAAWDKILTEEREKQDSLFVKWYNHRAKTALFSNEEIGDRLQQLKAIVQDKRNEIIRMEQGA